jgi:hypothetical protein
MTVAQIEHRLIENRLACRHWTKKEIKNWVKSYFNCSEYVATRVAEKVYYNKNLYV